MHQIIKHSWPTPNHDLGKVFVPVDRLSLAKRRWHVLVGEIDFGFDLTTPLEDGDIIFEAGTLQYVLQQKHEPILRVALDNPETAARRAWSLGNLHFSIQVDHDSIRVPDDPAIRLYFEREHIPFQILDEVFRPVKTVAAGHSHGHSHTH